MALLNLTNFDDHPTDPTWMVFRFGDAEMGSEFMHGLEQAGIRYEADRDEGMTLIGVKQRHRDAAIRINYGVLGRHREPFISSPYVRWGLLGLVLLAILAAFLGAWLNS
ncbi:MAG: hypothetical protein KF905_15340 [Flavobacteriales bacterium]|nr:hypothetical protein [Flavobacteriales bacterium]